MSSIILEAKSLTKEYKQTLALDHINLQIKKGKIYGFIGQNGAGKTTFLRLVTGLAFPTSGTLSLWGNSGTEELQKQRKRIGSMIEMPALFPSMTAYQNMEVQRIQRGIPDKSVIKRTLDMVGLQDTGKKSVRNFSLGMRQRLGIAIALLNTPELLILDEPINGLDPAGIVEIRNLNKIIYIFLTIFLYLLKCPQSLILSALRAFCFCGKPHISRSIFLYFRYQAWLKSW